MLIRYIFSEFLELCEKWQKESSQLVTTMTQATASRNSFTTNYRVAEVQSKRMEMALMKLAREFFEKEKSNSTKSQIDFTNEHVRFLRHFHLFWLQGFPILSFGLILLQDVEKNDWVDWFDVIPALTNIPKTSNMASKLCIQLHSFPKDAFDNIQKTKILTGQDSETINRLEVELRTLVSSIADVFL